MQERSAWPLADRPLPRPIKGRVTVVGVCAAGKTALVEGLRVRGYDARHCIQEHSHVADMWQRISQPEVLVYLDVSLEVIRQRRPDDDFDEEYIREQRHRLAHARQHCQIYVSTDALSIEGVLSRVVAGLSKLGIEPQAPGLLYFCSSLSFFLLPIIANMWNLTA